MNHTIRPHVDLSSTAWRKSSYSGDQGNCVEVADGFERLVPVRDSKVPGGPALTFTAKAWTDFVFALKSDRRR